MPHVTDDAICIRRWDWSETSQTVSLLTRGHGLIRGVAKGAKREKGRFSGGIDLLARGQIVAIIKRHSGDHSTADIPLATLTDWSITELYPAIRSDLRANRAGLYMADLVNHMILDQDPHAGVFDALTSALARLGDHRVIDRAVLEFQWALLRETGYSPELHRDIETGRALAPGLQALLFVPARGGFTTPDAARAAPGAPPRGWRVRAETLDLLRSLDSRDFDQRAESVDTTTRADAIGRANRLLAAYLRELIGREPPTLSWIFPDLAGS